MAELKTKKNDASVEAYLKSIKDEQRQADCRALVTLLSGITKAGPKMWGSSIVGFGDYHYVYETGREGDWFLTGFSSRKQALTIYAMACLVDSNPDMEKLGKFKHGKSCIYVKKLDDIDLKVLARIIKQSNAEIKRRYGIKK